MIEEHARLYSTLAMNIDELRALKSTQFEDEIARMFTRLGYDVTQTPYSNDLGRDAILTKDGRKYLVECKCYAAGGSSGRPPLQKLHSAMVTDEAAGGFFVTTGGFSDPARKFAKKNKIELVDPDTLVRLMLESKPAAANSMKYKSACHHCGELVSHDLRAPVSVKCSNGHEVKPSLDFATVLKQYHPSDKIEAWRYVGRYNKRIPNGWSSLDRTKVVNNQVTVVLASHGWDLGYA